MHAIHQANTSDLSLLQKRLLNDFQKDFPLSATPYTDLACELGVSEAEVLAELRELSDMGVISRIGAVLRPHRVGTSTLAAMRVPSERLHEIAERISAVPEVNHNYEREHAFNLWFVLTASDEAHLNSVLQNIEQSTGFEVMSLPLVEDYHIDLGFKLQW